MGGSYVRRKSVSPGHFLFRQIVILLLCVTCTYRHVYTSTLLRENIITVSA
jgi:hypothetical protein